MTDLLVPIGRVIHQVPLSMQGKVHNVNDMAAAHEISRAFGPNSRPNKPFLVWGPDGKSVMLVAGLGVATAAEIQDVVIAQLTRAEEKGRKNQRLIDQAQRRAAYGFPEREKFDSLFREALQEKVRRHKRNSRTDSGVKPHRQRVWQVSKEMH